MSDEEKKPDPTIAELLRSVPGIGNYEPGADARAAAANNWEYFQAHIQVGFTPDQAMMLLINQQTAALDAMVHYHFNNPNEDDS